VIVIVLVVIAMVVVVVVRPDRADLHLDAVHVGRHDDDERADITADVEDDRALPRVGVVRLDRRRRGRHG
jgi:hypothetical protein